MHKHNKQAELMKLLLKSTDKHIKNQQIKLIINLHCFTTKQATCLNQCLNHAQKPPFI